MEIRCLRGRDRQGGTKNRLLASQKTNTAGKRKKWKKKIGQPRGESGEPGGRDGRKTRRRGTGGASPRLARQGKWKEMGMEMARERGRRGVGAARFLGAGEGSGGGPRRTWDRPVRAGIFQKAQGSSGWGGSGRVGPSPLSPDIFRSGPSVYPFRERVPFFPFPVQGGWWLSISSRHPKYRLF